MGSSRRDGQPDRHRRPLPRFPVPRGRHRDEMCTSSDSVTNAGRLRWAQRFRKHKVGYPGITTYSSSSRRAHLTSRQVEQREKGCGLRVHHHPLPVRGLGVRDDAACARSWRHARAGRKVVGRRRGDRGGGRAPRDLDGTSPRGYEVARNDGGAARPRGARESLGRREGPLRRAFSFLPGRGPRSRLGVG